MRQYIVVTKIYYKPLNDQNNYQDQVLYIKQDNQNDTNSNQNDKFTGILNRKVNFNEIVEYKSYYYENAYKKLYEKYIYSFYRYYKRIFV